MLGVDEIIIYDSSEKSEPEAQTPPEAPKKIKLDGEQQKPNQKNTANICFNPDLVFCANMLQYLITPSHLRKLLFKPIGNPAQFKYAKKLGKIPGLLEHKHIALGIAIPRERKKRSAGQKKLSKRDRKEYGLTPYINLGYDRVFKLKGEKIIPINSRVYVDFSTGEVVEDSAKELSGKGAKGYSVRAVAQFSHIFTQSSLEGGYSQTVYIPSQQFKSNKPSHPLMHQVSLAQLGHEDKLLLVFGKWSEVQSAVNQDPDLDLDNASAIFDGVSLGTERARLEDSVTVTLARM